MLRALPIHLALLGLIVGLAGCPTDDGDPKGPYTGADPEVAGDDSTTAKPEPGDGDGDGDSDGDPAAQSCKETLAVCEAALTACETAKPK